MEPFVSGRCDAEPCAGGRCAAKAAITHPKAAEMNISPFGNNEGALSRPPLRTRSHSERRDFHGNQCLSFS